MRFQPGQSGNRKGRPKSDRLKPAQFQKSLRECLQGEGQSLLNKAVSLALEGDAGMLKFLLERLIAPVPFENAEERQWPDIAVTFHAPPEPVAVETPPAQPARVFKVPEFRGINQ